MADQLDIAPKYEWFGVKVVSKGTRTRSNVRLATIITVLLAGFLLAVQFVLPIFGTDPYSRWQFVEPRLFWPSFCFLLTFGWFGAFGKLQLFSGGHVLTLNSEVGPTSFWELLKDFITVRSESAPYATAMRDLNVGRLAVSDHGIRGIVTIPWRRISVVSSLSENRVEIRKTVLIPPIARIMGLDHVVLRFAGNEDAAQFLTFARLFLRDRATESE
ncbi:hypothetical protein ACVWW6_000925 [Bradyrhizobium sp. USDA 3311]